MATKTMFGPAKTKYLSAMISLRNPEAARGSVKELEKEYNSEIGRASCRERV